MCVFLFFFCQCCQFLRRNRCVDDGVALQQTVTSQGILGLGFSGLAVDGTDAFMSSLFNSNLNIPKNFAMRLCEHSGSLWIGGNDATAYLDNPIYTPLIPPFQYFTIQPNDVLVNGISLGFTYSTAFATGPNMLDSGTTLWLMPSKVYASVVAALIADAGFKKYFRSSVTNNFFQHPPVDGSCEFASTTMGDWATLQRELPTISITFTNGLVVTLDGVGSYLLPCSADYRLWTSGIDVTSGANTVLGWTALNQHVLFHDIENGQIGFAKQTGCRDSKSPLKTAVSLGQPTMQYSRQTK